MFEETNALTVYLGYTFLQTGLFYRMYILPHQTNVNFSEARSSGQVILEPLGQQFSTWATHLLKTPVPR